MTDPTFAPRFDGLYRGPVEQLSPTTDSVQYFRFYDDGLVVSVAGTTEEPPEAVAVWFHRDFEHAGRGFWTCEGDRISWLDVTQEGRRTIEVSWTGRIEGDAMVLDCAADNGHAAREQRFEWVAIAT